MRRWKSIFWVSAAILAITALLGSVAPSAIAQVRAALVRDLDGPVRGTRYSENFQLLFPSNGFSVSQFVTPAIPAGKKLFLKSISLHVLLTDNQGLMEARVSLNPGTIGRFWVDMDFQAAGTSQGHFTGNQEINIVLNEGESINVFLFRNNNLGSSGLNFASGSINGYLVDANP